MLRKKLTADSALKKNVILISALILLFAASCQNATEQAESQAMSVYRKLVMIFSDPDAVLRKEILGQWKAVETPKGESVVFENNGRYHGYDGRESYKGTWQVEKQRLILSLGGNYALKIQTDTLWMDEDKFIRNQEMLSLKK